MRLFAVLFLASYAVKCEENNYYVIQMVEEDTPVSPVMRQPLQVFWNVPTMQCTSKKIPFQNLDRFGIIQNTNDSFRGDQIAILYDPGFFPALLRNESSGQIRFRNGGVPQEGNLEAHLEEFRIFLEQSIPDKEFSGIGIIDFESWRPILRQNFGDVYPYKTVSYDIERSKHWWWPPPWIQAEAKQRFETAARLFMQNTISLAKHLRPNARWGYYGFPYCFNMASNTMLEDCSQNVQTENDQIDWLWMESSALYPSVYSSKNLTSSQLRRLIAGRVREAARERRKDTLILPYFWFRYRDGSFFNKVDLQTALKTLNQSEADGFIIWGSSNDVNTPEKCKKLLYYIENYMGPEIAKFTKPTIRQYDEVYHDNETLNDSIEYSLKNNTDSTTRVPLGLEHNTTLIAKDKNESTINKTNDSDAFMDEDLKNQDNYNIVMDTFNILIDILQPANSSEVEQASLTTENTLESINSKTTEAMDYLETAIFVPKNIIRDISEEYREALFETVDVTTENPLAGTTNYLKYEKSTFEPNGEDQKDTTTEYLSKLKPNKDAKKGHPKQKNNMHLVKDRKQTSTGHDQFKSSVDFSTESTSSEFLTLSSLDFAEVSTLPYTDINTDKITTTTDKDTENTFDFYFSQTTDNFTKNTFLSTEPFIVTSKEVTLDSETYTSTTTFSYIADENKLLPEETLNNETYSFTTTDSYIADDNKLFEYNTDSTTLKLVVSTSTEYTPADFSTKESTDKQPTTTTKTVETTTQHISDDAQKRFYKIQDKVFDKDDIEEKVNNDSKTKKKDLTEEISTETIPKVGNERSVRSQKNTIDVIRKLAFDKNENEYTTFENSHEEIIGNQMFSNPTADQVLVHMI